MLSGALFPQLRPLRSPTLPTVLAGVLGAGVAGAAAVSGGAVAGGVVGALVAGGAAVAGGAVGVGALVAGGAGAGRALVELSEAVSEKLTRGSFKKALERFKADFLGDDTGAAVLEPLRAESSSSSFSCCTKF